MDTKEGLWVGVDWSDRSHTVVVVNALGEKVKRFEVPHTAEGMAELTGTLRQAGVIYGVGVETTRHLVVTHLLEAGFIVYGINPRLSEAWRKGWKVAGPKSDAGDAWVLAEGLRQHHVRVHPMRPEDPKTRELAILCADESRLITQRTALVNQMQATLKEYFPEVLAWFDDWTSPSAWDFIIAFPDPETLNRATRRKLVGFLKSHRMGLRPVWQERLDQRCSSSGWVRDPAVVRAKSLLGASLAKQLRTLEATLRVYRNQIEVLFQDHPDAGIFASLPGAGPKLAPRLLAMFGTDRLRYDSAHSVQKLCGTVPVTLQSGKRRPAVLFRRACRKDFRTTLHLFAKLSTQQCEWARAFVQSARSKGQSYGCALRNLASKWLRIIFRMWKNSVPYDESRFLAALTEKRSPIIQAVEQSRESGKAVEKP